MMDELRTVESKIFDERYDWDAIDPERAKANTRVLDLVREACLIESYFAVYVGQMMEMFWYDVDATSVYTIEAFEAYTHYYLLRRYLETVGYKPVTDDEVRELREQERGVDHDDEIEELVNFMATEHFAAHFFNDLADRTDEQVLEKMLHNLAEEEVSHAKFAKDLLEKRLEKEATSRDEILEHAQDFQHVGSYVLPTVSRVSEDNLQIIQEFNEMVEDLTGTSVSEYKAKGGTR